MAAPREQRAEHVDRRPDPFDQLVRRDRRQVAVVGEDQPTGFGSDDRHADRAEQFRHDRHVDDLGDVAQLERPVGQQRGRHQLQHRVLGARHDHFTRQRTGVADHDQRFGITGSGSRARIRDGGGRDRIHRHQYAPPVPAAGRTVTRVWPDEPDVAAALEQPRDDLVLERQTPDGTFEQADGPFLEYERRLERSDGNARRDHPLPHLDPVVQLAVRAAGPRARRAPVAPAAPPCCSSGESVVGAARPADRTPDPRPRTARRGVDELGVHQHAVHPDRQVRGRRLRCRQLGRRRRRLDRARRHRARRCPPRCSPIGSDASASSRSSPGRRRSSTALGALAPTFPALVATQAIGRPLGLALDFLVAVVAAEEMPRNSRAYAVSVLAMASGFGAGIAVITLPLADIGESSWRFIYVVALVWLVVAVDIARRLPETTRFTRPHKVAPPLDPAALRDARPRRHRRQLLRRPGELLPEQLPGGRTRLLGRPDRVVHALDRDAGRHRLDHRRTHRRHPRPAAPARGRPPAGDDSRRWPRSP